MKHIPGSLKVFSGKCCLCDVGMETNLFQSWDYFEGDEKQYLHTGDIVLVWKGHYVGTDIEAWYPSGGLTVVVCDQYRTYSTGKILLIPSDQAGSDYVMGIRSVSQDDPEWKIQLVKKHFDVVNKEHWPGFGFHYEYSPVADAAYVGVE